MAMRRAKKSELVHSLFGIRKENRLKKFWESFFVFFFSLSLIIIIYHHSSVSLPPSLSPPQSLLSSSEISIILNPKNR